MLWGTPVKLAMTLSVISGARTLVLVFGSLDRQETFSNQNTLSGYHNRFGGPHDFSKPCRSTPRVVFSGSRCFSRRRLPIPLSAKNRQLEQPGLHTTEVRFYQKIAIGLSNGEEWRGMKPPHLPPKITDLVSCVVSSDI